MCSILGYVGNKFNTNQLSNSLATSITRGPDETKIIVKDDLFLGFNRLAIMDLSSSGMQPFEYKDNYIICNGEIYGYQKIKQQLIKQGVSFNSTSDCEVLLPMYHRDGIKFVKKLDAEFAFILYDAKLNKLLAARDPIGIRPLYYAYDIDGKIIFGSEPKMLINLSSKVMPFPPGYYYEDGKFICYCDITKTKEDSTLDLDIICKKIRSKLISGVRKRLNSDAKVGFLLSGGLDSSLICGISSKILKCPITTFSIGLNEGAVDLKYAAAVAQYLGSKHYEFTFTTQEVIDNLDTLIYLLGTYDITTIRASIGMYLLCKKIKEQTDVTVLLTGEISDELFGYKYTDFAPSANAFQEESIKRIRELHYYDVLRADRCISSNSLEARVPFGDLAFVKYVMSINPKLKLNTYDMGKYLLRRAFLKDNLIPQSILLRQKEAFSDGVGHSMVDAIKAYADKKYSDEEFERKKLLYQEPFGIISKESLLYKEIFHSYYGNNYDLIPSYWMPNKDWDNCNVSDPSARVLKNYGKSGE
jgi:asparagine synthase (glutamine-hydrolysing)